MTSQTLTKIQFFTLYVGLASDKPRFSVITNRERLFTILNSRHSHSYTVIEGIGSFKGRQEPCMSVSIAYIGESVNDSFLSYIIETANEIKTKLGQEEVWISKRDEGLRIV